MGEVQPHDPFEMLQRKEVRQEEFRACLEAYLGVPACPSDWYSRTLRSGETLPVYALKRGYIESLGLMLHHLPKIFPQGGSQEENLLWQAIGEINTAHGNEVLECILKFPEFVKGHAYETMAPDNQSVLHFAAQQGVKKLFTTLGESDKTALVERLVAHQHFSEQMSPHHLAAYYGHKETLEVLVSFCPKLVRDVKGETILHKAVSRVSNKPDVLEFILEKYPEILGMRDNLDRSPLQLVLGRRKNKQHGSAVQSLDEDLQTTSIARSLSYNSNVEILLRQHTLTKARKISDIRDILGKDCLGDDIFLNLSFLKDPFAFKEYLKVLEKLNVPFVPFDRFLKVVALPNLRCSRENPCEHENGLRTECEAPRVFDFLRYHRKVTHIFEVIVPDCPVHPHPDEEIKRSLRGLRVRFLDWRKEDLSIDLIQDVASEVEQLHLYSSGNKDILHHWESPWGLCQLKNLRKIEITLARGELELQYRSTPGISEINEDPNLGEEEKEEAVEKVISEEFQKEEEKWEARFRCLRLRTLSEVSREDPKERAKALHIHDLPEELPEIDHFRGLFISQCDPGNDICKPLLGDVKVCVEDKPPRPPSSSNSQDDPDSSDNDECGNVFEAMDKTFNIISRLTSNDDDNNTPIAKWVREHPIKVALLDSGVSFASFGEFDFHCRPVGRSFVENDNDSMTDTHWHSPSNSHGTMLARLIWKWTNRCKFYIGKIQTGSGPKGVDVNAAIKALEWVKSEEVDIICLSWSQTKKKLMKNPKQFRKLEKTIQEVALDSLIFCATGDKGSKADAPYPATFPSAIAITSYESNGDPCEGAEKDHTDFFFPAENLEVDAIPGYLQPYGQHKANGSSYGAALAAGLSSLILLCVQFAFGPGDTEERKDELNENMAAFKGEEMKNVFRAMCVGNSPHEHFVKPESVFEKWVDKGEDGNLREELKKLLKNAAGIP